MAENNSGNIWVPFLVGAAVGAAVALLTSPKTGAENRKMLGDGVRAGADRASQIPSAVSRAATEAGRVARDTFLNAYERFAGGGGDLEIGAGSGTGGGITSTSSTSSLGGNSVGSSSIGGNSGSIGSGSIGSSKSSGFETKKS